MTESKINEHTGRREEVGVRMVYAEEAHTLLQPNCPFCGLPLVWGKGYAHVTGFVEHGECGTLWCPDFEGGAVQYRSKSCEVVVELRARLTAWETTLTALMPSDMTDWHQNSKEDWPEVTASMIRNLREERDLWQARATEFGERMAEAEAERDALRSQLATLNAGKVWIPEPTLLEMDHRWRGGFVAAMEYARAHAVAVAVLPELTEDELTGLVRDTGGNPESDLQRELASASYNLARSRIRTIGPDQVVVGWIPCEERLPEDGQAVAFISRCERDSHYHGRVLGGRYVAGEFGGFTVPGLMTDASHWLPLPAVPDALLKAAPEGVAG